MNRLLRPLTLVSALAIALLAVASPRYVFYFIGDGMGMGHVMAAQNYNRIVRGNTDPLLMMQFPVASVAMTYSASSPVTDSAAAGTALASGVKTRNSMLGMNPDTVAVNSIARTLKDQGWGIGVISSVYPDDATPGAFYAHQPSRSMYYEIGCEAAKSGYEFIGGSNLRGVKVKGEPSDLYQQLAQAGYDVVRGTDAAAASVSERVFLLSPDSTRTSNIGYTIDSIPGAMTLPAMTETCLAHLERVSPDHFFMMVEGGNIDHAAHGNDGGAVVKEIVNFNDALRVAYDFYLAHPEETLIVVTADHDTGGLALNNAAKGNPEGLRYIDLQRLSKERFSDQCKTILNSRRLFLWDDMREMLQADFGFWSVIPVTEEQEIAMRDKFIATFEQCNSADQKTLYASFNAFAVEVFKVLDSFTGIAWTTTSHTGNPVPVYAIGVGAERFAALNNNIDIPTKILDIINQ